MKCLLVLIFVALALVAADEEWKPPSETPDEITEKCFQESGVTKLQRVKLDNKEHPEEKEIYDHVLCVVKKYGVFTEDSGYNTNGLLSLCKHFGLDAEKAREIVTKCVDTNEEKSTPAVWTYRGVKCMMDNKMDDLFKEAYEKTRNNNEKKV